MKRDENAVERKDNISVMLSANEKAEFIKAGLVAGAKLGVNLGGAGMGRIALRMFKAYVDAGMWADIVEHLDAETVLAPSTRKELGLD